MKEVMFEKTTEMALIGALATIEVTEDLCGKEFTDALVRQVSPLNFVDRLTFWNLINVSMNSNKSTHIFTINWTQFDASVAPTGQGGIYMPKFVD